MNKANLRAILDGAELRPYKGGWGDDGVPVACCDVVFENTEYFVVFVTDSVNGIRVFDKNGEDVILM